MTDIVTNEMVLAAAKAQRPDLWDAETGRPTGGLTTTEHMMAMDLAERGLRAGLPLWRTPDGAQPSLVEVLERAAKIAGAMERRQITNDAAFGALERAIDEHLRPLLPPGPGGSDWLLAEVIEKAGQCVASDRAAAAQALAQAAAAVRQRDVEAGHVRRLERELERVVAAHERSVETWRQDGESVRDARDAALSDLAELRGRHEKFKADAMAAGYGADRDNLRVVVRTSLRPHVAMGPAASPEQIVIEAAKVLQARHLAVVDLKRDVRLREEAIADLRRRLVDGPDDSDGPADPFEQFGESLAAGLDGILDGLPESVRRLMNFPPKD